MKLEAGVNFGRLFCKLVITVALVSGCSSMNPTVNEIVMPKTAVTAPQAKLIIPKEVNLSISYLWFTENGFPVRDGVPVKRNVFNDEVVDSGLNFPVFSMCDQVFASEKNVNEFKISRRSSPYNKSAYGCRPDVQGAVKTYAVQYGVEKDENNIVVLFSPVSVEAYYQAATAKQWNMFGQKLNMPVFEPGDIIKYIAVGEVYYRLEIDSPYNIESTYSNFTRMVKPEPYKKGEVDPVTGKVFKNRYELPTKYGKITFSVEVFPYRNGSKAVIGAMVPGALTSENVVDFNIILKEVKEQLTTIVQS
jgi:hypothetical protein